MTEKKSTGARKRRPPTELRVTPESEKWLKERAASPEGQKLLDELAMVFVEAAVRRLLKEQALRDAVQLLKSFEFYANKNRRNSLNRPRSTISSSLTNAESPAP